MSAAAGERCVSKQQAERVAVEAAVTALAHLSTLQLSVDTMQPVMAAYALLLASAAPNGAQDSPPSLQTVANPVVPFHVEVSGLIGLSAELHVQVFEFCSTQSLALLERSCHWPSTVAARTTIQEVM